MFLKFFCRVFYLSISIFLGYEDCYYFGDSSLRLLRCLRLLGSLKNAMLIFYFNRTGYISLPFAILSTATMILGALFILVALILYAINKINRETRRHPLESI